MGTKAVKAFSSVPGKRVNNTGIIIKNWNGAEIVCASLNDFAYIDIARRMDAKNTQIGTIKENTVSIVGTLIISSNKLIIWLGICGFALKLKKIPIIAENDDAKADNVTTITLPITMSSLLAGEDTHVSRVPLSFSPAPKSRAGYKAPIKPSKIKK